MEQLTKGHFYIMIVQGVSHGGGIAYYNVLTKDIIYEEGEDEIRPKFLSKVTCLIDYIVSTKETSYTFEEFCDILTNIRFLCRHENPESDDPSEMMFGFPKGTLCYEDDEDYNDEEDNHTPNISDHINRMENEFLQCDNADVFIVGKHMWPLMN